jgi:putative FmdB family regulatory protein
MMPVYDYLCRKCGEINDEIRGYDEQYIKCPDCGRKSKRLITGTSRQNDDAAWVRSVVDVVDKKSKNPATREFIKTPTRANLKRHLQATGLRHVEPGEQLGRITPDFDVKAHTDKLMKYRQQKNSIELRG